MVPASETSSSVREARIELPNGKDTLERLALFTHDFAARAALPQECAFALDLALTEWVTNIISYGFRASEAGHISVHLSASPSHLRVEVEDSANPFNPLERAEVDTTKPMDEKPIGGLGIHLIRKFMDAVSYERRNHKNTLIMSRRLAPGSSSNGSGA